MRRPGTVTFPRRFRGQFKPRGVPRIDWSHPLAAGLVDAWITVGGTPFSLVTGTFLNQGTPGTQRTTVAGDGRHYAGGNSQIEYAVVDRTVGNSVATLAVFVTPDQFNASGTYWFGHASTNFGSGQGRLLLLGPGGSDATAVRVLAQDSAPNDWSTPDGGSGTVTANVPLVVAGEAHWNASSATNLCYLNGKLVGSRAVSSSTGQGTNNTSWGGGYRSGGALGLSNGSVHLALEWARALTPGEHELLGKDPTCFLIFPEDDLFALLASVSGGGGGSGVAFTSTLASLTGYADTFRIARALSDASATGSVSGLSTTYSIQRATSGTSSSVSGTSSSWKISRLITSTLSSVSSWLGSWSLSRLVTSALSSLSSLVGSLTVGIPGALALSGTLASLSNFISTWVRNRDLRNAGAVSQSSARGALSVTNSPTAPTYRNVRDMPFPPGHARS